MNPTRSRITNAIDELVDDALRDARVAIAAEREQWPIVIDYVDGNCRAVNRDCPDGGPASVEHSEEEQLWHTTVFMDEGVWRTEDERRPHETDYVFIEGVGSSEGENVEIVLFLTPAALRNLHAALDHHVHNMQERRG